jgi:hypothetical protein
LFTYKTIICNMIQVLLLTSFYTNSAISRCSTPQLSSAPQVSQMHFCFMVTILDIPSFWNVLPGYSYVLFPFPIRHLLTWHFHREAFSNRSVQNGIPKHILHSFTLPFIFLCHIHCHLKVSIYFLF